MHTDLIDIITDIVTVPWRSAFTVLLKKQKKNRSESDQILNQLMLIYQCPLKRLWNRKTSKRKMTSCCHYVVCVLL